MNKEKNDKKIVTKTISLDEELSENDQKYNIGYIFIKNLVSKNF